MRSQVDLRPPELHLHGIAGRELAINIPVIGGVLTSPVITMKTAGGDPYTTDPGVGAASMAPTVDTLRLLWTAADMAALNATTRAKSYRLEIAGVINGASVSSVIGGTLTVYPTTWARSIPSNDATLVLNGGTTVTLSVTVPPLDAPVDGGAADWTADIIDGGTPTSVFTDTTYDGGSI